MERKRIVKKESKIKKNEENRIEFLNSGVICTTKSEIFSESSLIETEVSTNRTSMDSENLSTERVSRRSTLMDCENCSTERINRGSTVNESCLDNQRMGTLQRDESAKSAVLDHFNKMRDLNKVRGDDIVDNRPSIAIDPKKDLKLYELNEGSNSSECFKGNRCESYNTGGNLTTDAKCFDCNPSNELHSNANEVIESSISTKHQENAEYQAMKVTPDVEINVHNTGNNSSQISYNGALNLPSAGEVLSTEFNSLASQSHNLGEENKHAEKTEGAVHNQNCNTNINEGKELEENTFFSNGDIYEHGDHNLISFEDKEKKNKVGVFKGKDNFNISFDDLVNYFDNIKKPSPKATDLEPVVYSSKKRKLSDTTKRQRKKLTGDHILRSEKSPLGNSLNSRLPFDYFNSENCTRKTCFASKNIGLMKKINDNVQPHCSRMTDLNFNFNDDTAEFCVVKCKQSQIGTKHSTPRQPREKGVTFIHRAINQSNQILSTPKRHDGRKFQDLQKHSKENLSQQNILTEKLTTEKQKNINPVADNANALTDRVELISFDSKEGYQHKKTNKTITDEQKTQKSNLDLEKWISMNNSFYSRKHLLKEGISKIQGSTYEKVKGKSLDKEESSSLKSFSSLILLMVILAFGSYYRFYE